MSESAVILEGEVARQFNPVDKLRATNQDSSVSDWVPSDTLDLGSLMASENTLYLANIDDDCDAYEEVEVDVSEELEDGDYKKITGKGNDGNDYAVGLDENGNLTSEMIPSAIHIVIKPRKLEYEEGETLDFTGIHVYLMDGNNHLFTSEDYPTGEIPFEELLLPITVAHGSSDRHASSDIDLSPLTQPIAFAYGNASYSYDWGGLNYNTRVTVDGFVTTVVFKSGGGIGIILAARESKTFFCENWTINSQGEESEHQTTTGQLSGTFEHNGKTVYWGGSSAVSFHFDNIVAIPCAGEIAGDENVASALDPKIAWTMVYGDNSGSGGQIPVQFQRSDGEILEDSFQINVSEKSESNSTESNSTESDSGSGHTSGGF